MINVKNSVSRDFQNLMNEYYQKQSEWTLSKIDWKDIIQNQLNIHNQNIIEWPLSKIHWKEIIKN
jgi:hypothetical protein